MTEEKLYKGKYIIAFYERDDDTLRWLFSNLKEVCRQLALPVTRSNMNRIQVDIYRSLRRHDHQTNLFRGQCLHVYIIDTTEDEDEGGKQE